MYLVRDEIFDTFFKRLLSKTLGVEFVIFFFIPHQIQNKLLKILIRHICYRFIYIKLKKNHSICYLFLVIEKREKLSR